MDFEPGWAILAGLIGGAVMYMGIIMLPRQMKHEQKQGGSYSLLARRNYPHHQQVAVCSSKMLQVRKAA